jgi:formylglycine-generating enzyme required for sulfatase activity
MLALVLLAATLTGSRPAPHVERVRIPEGSYRPLYAPAGAGRVHVDAFSIDREPVTRAEFEAFVRQHPTWQRGTIKGVFAESAYLSDWPSATDAGIDGRQRPVTELSWFAAKAYCSWRGGRLPTVDEWEYVAAASATKRDASGDTARAAALVTTYAARAGHALRDVGSARPNAFGVSDLHELVWEWTSDFNSVLVSDDSRSMGAGGDERDHHLFCASAAIGATAPTDYAAFLRYAFRAGLTGRSTVRSLGFRCASSA